LSFERANVDRRAEGSEIMVIADALNPNGLAVEQKAPIGVEHGRADTEGRLDTIDDFVFPDHGDNGGITVWLR
jgi:hypothetical protein